LLKDSVATGHKPLPEEVTFTNELTVESSLTVRSDQTLPNKNAVEHEESKAAENSEINDREDDTETEKTQMSTESLSEQYTVTERELENQRLIQQLRERISELEHRGDSLLRDKSKLEVSVMTL